MRINLGIKAFAGLSAMLLSVAVISGCNEEGTSPSTSPTTNPAPAAGSPAPAKKPEAGATPPPPTPPKDEKPAEKH